MTQKPQNHLISLMLILAICLMSPSLLAASEADTSDFETVDSPVEKTVSCTNAGTSCTGPFSELFVQIYVQANGAFRLQPLPSVLATMQAQGLDSTCFAYNGAWFSVLPDDGDGGEKELKISMRIASLTNQTVRFYVAAVSSSDTTCRFTGFHFYQ